MNLRRPDSALNYRIGFVLDAAKAAGNYQAAHALRVQKGVVQGTPAACRRRSFPVPPPPAPPIQFPSEPYIPAPPPGNSVNGVPVPPVAPPGGALPVAPSATDGEGPSVAVVPYDPGTGKYMTPDGRYEQQTNLIAGGAPKSWQDLMPT